MQTKDHKTLALQLLSNTDHKNLRRFRWAFLLGCVEPDYNPLTYMRGSLHHRPFHGHNAENVQQHIEKCLKKLQASSLRSPLSYFTLGTLIHYVADTFTFPHQARFRGSTRNHIQYEHQLHHLFLMKLSDLPGIETNITSSPLRNFLALEHRQYCAAPHSMDTDCIYIIQICTTLLDKLLHSAPTTINLHTVWEADSYYEGSYHYGLV